MRIVSAELALSGCLGAFWGGLGREEFIARTATKITTPSKIPIVFKLLLQAGHAISVSPLAMMQTPALDHRGGRAPESGV